jgi:outer membrane protein assembly factor BamE (lipoprotein component of BamABCDE complex)
MKIKMFPLVVTVALLAGCATPQPANTKRSSVGDISNPEAETPPFIGMTKAQALARYGEPKKRTMTDDGENWVYLLNFGEMMGKAMIPFNFKPTVPRTGVLIFGADGRVKKFNWDKETNG